MVEEEVKQEMEKDGLSVKEAAGDETVSEDQDDVSEIARPT
jgi:hypothetical protein